MGWFEFIAAVVKATAWPVVLIIALLLFREPLRRVIRSLRTFKYKEMEVRFEVERTLSRIEEKIAEQGESLPHSVEQKAETTRSAGVSSPQAMVNRAWYSVRRAIWELGKNSGMISANRLTPIKTIKWLEDIDDSTAQLIRKLKRLRDLIKSNYGVLSIDFEQAERFQALASSAVASLKLGKAPAKRTD